MNIKIKKIHPNATIPQYATAGAACFDLHACLSEKRYVGGRVSNPSEPLNMQVMETSGGNVKIPTGLSFEIPEGYVMMIYSRSGHGFKNNVRLANCVGVIDSDYRGEVQVALTNDYPNTSNDILTVNHGDRIAQAMIVPVNQVTFEEVEELSETERGNGGFGSTGV